MKYLDPADHNPARITKADKDFAKELDFKNIKLLFKVTDKIAALAFLVMKTNYDIQSMFLKKIIMLTYYW